MDLNGKTVLVTGAMGGHGSALVASLRTAGAATIYATDLRASEGADGVVVSFALDITDPRSVAAAAARSPDVDVLVNNAGISLWRGFLIEADIDAARREMEVNYFGTMAMCRAFAPLMVRRGSGTIVNILSVVARVNFAGCGSYSASKAASWSMTQAMRAELADMPVHIICVFPGMMDTPMLNPDWGTPGEFDSQKNPPELVAAEVVRAIAEDLDEIYAGVDAMEDGAGLDADYRATEKRFASYLPPQRRFRL
jgi:NAD(P)-dependent dehydrogenase (short-subunit alcohol dehydrogenase family)